MILLSMSFNYEELNKLLFFLFYDNIECETGISGGVVVYFTHIFQVFFFTIWKPFLFKLALVEYCTGSAERRLSGGCLAPPPTNLCPLLRQVEQLVTEAVVRERDLAEATEALHAVRWGRRGFFGGSSQGFSV